MNETKSNNNSPTIGKGKRWQSNRQKKNSKKKITTTTGQDGTESYNTSDDTLLVDFLEIFFEPWWKQDNMHPKTFVPSPGLTLNTVPRFTKTASEIIRNPRMFLLFEKSVTDGRSGLMGAKKVVSEGGKTIIHIDEFISNGLALWQGRPYLESKVGKTVGLM